MIRLELDEQEQTCVTLRMYAAVIADFYRSLVDQGYPAGAACDLALAWFEGEVWEEADDDD